MEEDIKALFEVSVTVVILLSYCYFLASKVSRGVKRVLSVLPVVFLLGFLPLLFNSVYIRGISAFYLTWLCNFKIFLFCFDEPPISAQSDSWVQFVFKATLPVMTRSSNPLVPFRSTTLIPSLSMTIKGILLAFLLQIYAYRDRIPTKLMLVVYIVHIYLSLELILAGAAAAVRTLLGFDLEPQFNEPYLSTSLQDFWGRRWNLVVTNILRQTVYNPIRRASDGILGKKSGQLFAIMTTFSVSGLMHEIMYYYLIKQKPTWEVTWFFLLHGFCTASEIVLKRCVRRNWWIPAPMSTVISIGFLTMTSFWLFFPPIVRSGIDETVIRESLRLLEILNTGLSVSR